MRRSTQKLAPYFVVLMAALLAFPGIFNFNRTPVSAFAQDTSRSDAKPVVKQASPQPPNVGITAPTNDNCANAIAITSCPFTDTQDTTGATTEAGEPAPCGAIGATMWYTVTTGDNFTQFNLSTCTNAATDTVIAVYKVNGAACDFANFAAVGCNDDFCGLQSTVQFTGDPNSTYKIQVGGFAGDTGSITLNVECTELECDPIVINGTLGSGDPNFEGTQFSGNQVGRLNRNGIASTCAAPKACLIFTATGNRAFDAYEIPNESGEDACVTITLHEDAAQTCNLQSNAYLNTYDPNSICTGYLGDPGLSTGVPPTNTNFSVVVPAGQTLIVVVHTTNPGETGCPYTVTVQGNLCRGFDLCVQNDRNPLQFVLVNSETGDYEYHDCSKGIVLAGTGVITRGVPNENCKFLLTDSGPDPKRPDRAVSVQINICTRTGSASIRYPRTALFPTTFSDSNIDNNTCECPD